MTQIKEFLNVKISDTESISLKEYEKCIAELEMEDETLKKATAIFSRKRQKKLLPSLKSIKIYPVKRVCNILNFPRGYYKALLHVPSKREKEASTLKSKIYELWKESKRRHGALKIQKVLES